MFVCNCVTVDEIITKETRKSSAIADRPRDALSLTGRAMLHVIEYFAKSLKFIGNDAV